MERDYTISVLNQAHMCVLVIPEISKYSNLAAQEHITAYLCHKFDHLLLICILRHIHKQHHLLS